MRSGGGREPTRPILLVDYLTAPPARPAGNAPPNCLPRVAPRPRSPASWTSRGRAPAGGIPAGKSTGPRRCALVGRPVGVPRCLTVPWRRSSRRREPSNQAALPSVPAPATPPPSSGRSPGQRAGHRLDPEWRPNSDATPRPRSSPVIAAAVEGDVDRVSERSHRRVAPPCVSNVTVTSRR
jgi:hypothetical protein